uniref:Uncharacterized protein TCIL3000_4_3540 n=1 Tax=Trypanosoma congolense (strain IL3000) TaxID=1068625 RepID=G0ULJ7_TRYCI|nr:unnamed protein product [Trypanosoma congolense IL3000]
MAAVARRANALLSTSGASTFHVMVEVGHSFFRSKECGVLVIMALLLVVRTFLSLRTARVNARVSEIAIGCNLYATMHAILILLGWFIPIAVVNSSLKYCIGMLGLRMQANLAHHFHRIYLDNDTFFAVTSSNTVKNIDERITRHIMRWSANVATMFASILNPLIMIGMFSYRVAAIAGPCKVLTVAAYYAIFSAIAQRFSPDMESLVGERLSREATLITAHNRLLKYAEELVMTQGQSFHRDIMNHYLESIVQHLSGMAWARSRYEAVENYFLKYGSRLLSYVVCVVVVFSKDTDAMTGAELVGQFAEVSYIFLNLSKGIGGFLRNFKSLFVVRALTDEIFELHDCIERAAGSNRAKKHEPHSDVTVGKGEMVYGEHIEFEKVPVVLPTNEILCKELTFHVKPGMNLLVLGPNGCGKSSLLRLLAGLWPLRGGRVVRPRSDHIYYIPQQPYMSCGTLRDQITYPLHLSELEVSESTLYSCLEVAMLDHILSRPHITWGTQFTSADNVLSLGEKQKLSIARLFYHRPRFAVLDECTSNMDMEVEERLYDMCRDLGISLITIAHRHSTWRHHNWVLWFDSHNSFMFSPLVFKKDGSMVLSRVVAAADPSVIGREVPMNPSYWRPEEERASVAH